MEGIVGIEDGVFMWQWSVFQPLQCAATITQQSCHHVIQHFCFSTVTCSFSQEGSRIIIPIIPSFAQILPPCCESEFLSRSGQGCHLTQGPPKCSCRLDSFSLCISQIWSTFLWWRLSPWLHNVNAGIWNPRHQA